MEVKVKSIAGFKANVEATGASTSIAAVVVVEGEKYANIENGSVKAEDGRTLATFNHFGGISINYLTTDEDEIIAAVTDVTHFVKYCKANAGALGKVTETEPKGK